MEKNNKKIIIIVECLVIIGIIVGLVIASMNKNSTSNENNNSNKESSSDEEIVVTEESTDLSVEYTSDELSGKYSDYKAKIDLSSMSANGSGVSVSGTTITIQEEGVYYFSGTTEDGNIVVNAEKKEVVLVFENANITAKNTSVINVIKSKKTTINLVENSTNTFTDSANYTEFTDDDEPNACVFSKSDLVINGNGTLKINANYQDGIASKDTLKIINATINVNSADDGIRGKDYTAIKDSNITIKSTGDGIKSTNEEDETLGFIIIDNGNITIEAEEDGIKAETVLNITNSNIKIKTTGEIAEKTNNYFKGFNNQNSSSNENDTSSKGLKAGKEITINSGNIEIDSTDDSIHSNNYIIINGGTINLSTGDDGIHADSNILINNGTINIKKSYEGIEANHIKIVNGDISVIASDDGINVSGGSETMGMRPQNFASDTDKENRVLIIEGGNIYVNADGDGLDSNGSIQISGGNIEVAGSVNGGNAALDFDNTCTVTGGSLIVYGQNGMWQNPSTTSTQYSIAFSATGSSGDKIELKDSNGNTITSFEAKKAYGMICISSSELKKGETYTLYKNGENVSSQELTSIVTSNGSSEQGNMQQKGMRNGSQGDMQKGMQNDSQSDMQKGMKNGSRKDMR